MNITKQHLFLRYPWLIGFSELTEQEMIWATDNGLFTYLKNPSENICKKAIIKNPSFIRYIKNPSKELQKECLDRDPLMLQYIDNYDDDLALELMRKHPYEIFGLLKNPSQLFVLMFLELTKNDNVKEKNSILLNTLINNVDNPLVADIIVKELYKNDEFLLNEWKIISRKFKMKNLLK